MTIGLAMLATCFVFVCGANDGGALLALAVRHGEVSTFGVLGLLLAAIVTGPALFGLAVADTFTSRLVDAGGVDGPRVVLGGVAVALVLVAFLTWRGLPTSLTVAVLGGLAGVGAGLGAPPVWSTLGTVLAVAAVSPFVGAAIGYALGLIARRIPSSKSLPSAVRLAHVTAFAGQSLAYAANDGQKMFAVVGVAIAAMHGTRGTQAPPVYVLCGLAAVFACGAVLSLRRMSRGATFDLMPPRPWHLVSAELASATTVLGSAGVGVPVSMTQSMAAGLVGAGASQGARRIRWQFALPVLAAWLVTLPASLALGYLVGLVVSEVGP